LSCRLFGGCLLNAGGLGGISFDPDCHVRAHLAAKSAPGALGLVDYLGVMVPCLVKQLAHPDITQRTLGHAKATPLTPLFVYLDISHKTPKTVLIHLSRLN